MKSIKYIVVALLAVAGCSGALRAQQLKIMEYNILSFEGVNNYLMFNVDPVVNFIKTHNPDIICFNEFETDTSREGAEKLTEVGSKLGMFPFFGFSYVKNDGFYGNGILSKYPIVNAGSKLLVKPAGSSDQRSYEWVDILVPTASKPNGVVVRIICTHLDHVGGQLEQAQQIVKEAFDPNIPTILAGDMNVGASSATISAYTAICDRVCDNTATFGNSSKLDYLLSFPKSKWEAVSYQVDKSGDTRNFSDHYPIIGVVKLK